MPNCLHSAAYLPLLGVLVCAALGAGCASNSDDNGSDGPTSSEAAVVHMVGDVNLGKQVFRFETFGNERFWTDAARLQQGIVAAGVTPIQALQLGLSVDTDALDAATLVLLCHKRSFALALPQQGHWPRRLISA